MRGWGGHSGELRVGVLREKDGGEVGTLRKRYFLLRQNVRGKQLILS